MESLYRKYRPQTFADVVGQQHVVGTLEHAVLEGRTSHAYLFCGPRGTGKTTMARLLAKALMCEHGPGQLPCGNCAQCQLIAAGEHPDVYELDAASRTGVDSVREEIINSVNYAPTQGRYKLYIIDEVHMLSTAAFNALLKTLEEPPDHVVFVLCTTDPQKIPATILSRVQRFDFRPIGNGDILAHLSHVCEQEGFTYEEPALELVCANARGGMRDALSTLEQLSVFGGGVISLSAAQDMLGAVSGSALEGVVDALARRDVPALFTQVGDMVDAGRDLLQFTRELAARLRDVYVAAAVGDNPTLLQTANDPKQLKAEAAAFGSTDRLARMLSLLGDVSREMGTAPNQRLVLEIAFTKMARPEEDLTIESLAERVSELERRLANAGAAVPATHTPDMPRPAVRQPAEEPPRPAVHQPAEEPPKPAVHISQPVEEPVRDREPMQTQAPDPAQPMDSGALQRAWKQVVSELMANIPARGTLLTNAIATSDNGSELVVSLPKGSAFALKMLERPDVRSIVEGAVANAFGRRTLVFREGTATDLQIPSRRQQSAPVSQPVAPAPQPVVPASAPTTAAQQPQQPQAAPVRQPSPEPGYPMPWDAPEAGAQTNEEPYYEAVPYEEIGGYVTQDSEVDYDGTLDSVPVTAPAPRSTSAPIVDPRPQVAPALEPQDRNMVEQPVPAFGEEPKETPAEPDARPDMPTDLPPELTAILENAFEVFGSGVRVSKEP